MQRRNSWSVRVKVFLPGLFAAAAALAFLNCRSARADTYTWNTSAAGNWNANSSWSPNTAFPSLAGDVADFTNSLSANVAVALGGPVTAGIVNLGDASTSYTFTLSGDTLGSTLTLNNNGAGGQINFTATSDGDTVAAPIVIGDAGGLTVLSSNGAGAANPNVVSGGVSGAGNLTITNNQAGAGQMQFTTSQLNNSGSIALSGTSTTATTLIGGGIGGNVGSLTNNSGNIVNITTTALSNSGTITNAGTSSNPMTISAAITGSAASLVQSSSTSTLILSAANTFGGGVTIKSGTLQVNTGANINAFGSGTITLGDTADTGAAVALQFNGVQAFPTFANALNVTGNGPALIYATSYNPVFSNLLTLSNTNGLTIGSSNALGSTLNFNGGVSGTGNITASIDGSNAASAVLFNDVAVNNSGTLTFNNASFAGGTPGTGTAPNKITGGVGSNVTAITQASNFNPLTISGSPITVNGSVGTTLISSGSALFTVSGGVSGTGNLTLGADGAGGITLSGSAGNAGSITNSGSGAGTVTISGVIGPNATSLLQSSSTSPLLLTAANTFFGDTTVSAGTLVLNVSGALKYSVVNLNGGNLSFGTLNTASLAGLAGTGNLNLANTAGTTIGLTIGNSNASNGSNTLNPTYSGVLSGSSTGVTKVGSDTQVFTNANTYAGTTLISAGTLQLDISPATPNVLPSATTLTLGGGALSVQGNSSSGTAVTQTIGTLGFTANTSSQILLGDTGSTPGTSLLATVDSAGPASGTALYLNEANGGTLTLGTIPTAAISTWAVVTSRNGNTGFGSINTSHQLVLQTTTTVLSSSSNTSSIDYTTTPSDPGYNSSGTLTMTTGNHSLDSLFITANSPGTLVLNGNLTFAAKAMGMAGSGNYTISGSGQLGASGSNLLLNQVGGGTLAVNVPVSGTSGSFTQEGNGVVVLGASNSYTGTTLITGGTLRLGPGGSINSANTLQLLSPGGAFDLNGNSQTFGSLNNNGLVTSSGASATLTVNNGTTDPGNFSGAMNVIWNEPGNISLNGTWSNTGNIVLTMTGTGTNQFVLGGTVANVGSLTLNAQSGTILFNGAAVNNVGSITSSGTGSGLAEFTAPIGSNVTSLTENSATSLMTINAANTFSGGVVIRSGTVSINNTLSLGSGTATLGDPYNSAAGTAAVLQLIAGNTYANALTVVGTGSDAILVTNNSPTWNGPVTLNSNLALAITSTSVAGSSLTFAGGVSGTGSITVSLDYAGAATSVTFKTLPVNNGGTLTFNNAAVFGGTSGSGTGTNTISGGVGSNVTGIIQASNSNPLTISTSAVTVNGGGTTLTASGSALFTVSAGVNGTGNLIFNNNTANAGVFSISSGTINNVGLVVNSGSGAGVTIGAVIGAGVTGLTQSSASSPLTLAGANTYTGLTTISAGTLALGAAGSINSSSGIAIAGGATYDVSAVGNYTFQQSLSATGAGTAYVNGSVNVGSSSLNLEDGTNLGTLAFNNNLSLSGGTLTFDLGNVGSDEITIAGSAMLSGNNFINVAPLAGGVTSLAGSYTLITAAGGGLANNTDFALSSNTISVGGIAYNLVLSSSSGSEVLLAGVTAGSGTWNTTSGTGSWMNGNNWSPPAVPATSGTATFAGSPTAPVTVTLDGAQSIAALVFSTSSGNGYTLSQGSVACELTLGTPAGASIAVLGGTHVISAPLTLAGNLTVTPTAGAALAISGPIGESDMTSLTLAGPGSLILSGSNNYSGGTIVDAGTLYVTSAAALPGGSSLTVGAGGTMIFDPSFAGGLAEGSVLAGGAASPAREVAAVPEPGTLALLLVAALGSTVIYYRNVRIFGKRGRNVFFGCFGP